MKFKTKIKVCGLTRISEVTELVKLGVDYAGFIFYEKSKRYVIGKISPAEIKGIKGIQKVGVFVNATEKEIIEKIDAYGLDLVQLHGEENPDLCRRLNEGIPVMKAFKIKNGEELQTTDLYRGCCDYFLFDTAGRLYGGNGTKFDWDLLKAYRDKTPFFLSGGIGLEEVPDLKKFQHPAFYAVDVNSKFEDAPGIKNMEKIKQFLWDYSIK